MYGGGNARRSLIPLPYTHANSGNAGRSHKFYRKPTRPEKPRNYRMQEERRPNANEGRWQGVHTNYGIAHKKMSLSNVRRRGGESQLNKWRVRPPVYDKAHTTWATVTSMLPDFQRSARPAETTIARDRHSDPSAVALLTTIPPDNANKRLMRKRACRKTVSASNRLNKKRQYYSNRGAD